MNTIDPMWSEMGRTGPQGEPGLPGIPGADGLNGSNGTDGAGFVLKGLWNKHAHYQTLDVVTLNGSSYAATKPNSNRRPGPKSKYWQVLAQAGAKGPKGDPGWGMRGRPGIDGRSIETQTIEVIFDQTTLAGMAVYASSDGHVDLAMADERYQVIGLAKEDTASGATGEIVLDGILSLPDWSNVIHESSLFVGSQYYLSHTTPGFTTKQGHDETGFYVQPVFRSVNLTAVEIEIGRPVLL